LPRAILKLVAIALALAAAVAASERVEILFNVPPGLEDFTGAQPVTFGVPFGKGALLDTHGLGVVDEAGAPLPAQFKITAVWAPGSHDVRWLLVDTVADLRQGKARRAFLLFGPDVARTARELMAMRPLADPVFSASQFALSVAPGGACQAADVKTEIEMRGAVRSTVKSTGRYVTADGKWIADFVTRYRVYAGQPFMRVYHTLVWQTDASVRIGGLWFTPDGNVSPGDAGAVTAGVDGKAVALKNATVSQGEWNVVSGAAQGAKLDGWAEAESGGGRVFAALRWPWQQFPTAFRGQEGRVAVGLLAPQEPMSLAPLDVAVTTVKADVNSWNLRTFDGAKLWNMTHNGPDALPHVSPRGVARTWEVVVWRDSAAAPAPERKNLLAQQPVLAFADPAFAVKAALPSPASPRDTKTFPAVEAALERAFDWFTLQRATDGDYGVWNWGDIQWCWTRAQGYSIYRYWMNNGKGWSATPWALWLRSGDRRYWDHGEANSRHVMDIDTCHAPEWTYAPDGKIRGGQYHYSPIHWGYGPEVSTFFIDSEYLPTCYYMTGYERAWDVTLLRAEALARDCWQERVQRFTDHKDEISRHLYVVIKDLAALYEATWDERLLPYLRAYVELTLGAQTPDGGFPGVKTPHYLDQPLHLALRVLGDERISQALRRWHDHMGDAETPGPLFNIEGPWSLWTPVTAWRATRDARYLRAAAEAMFAQAGSVDEGDSEWRGMNPVPAHEAGPLLRDWPTVMAALREMPPDQRPAEPAPMLYFQNTLPIAPEAEKQGWKDRHVVLVLDEKDDPFSVSFYWIAHNFSSMRDVRVRVLAPDGAVVSDTTLGVGASKDGSTGPRVVEVAADGRKGVYAFEVFTSLRRSAIHARATTGKRVHFAPGKTLIMHSPAYAGRAWFQPLPGAEVVFNYPRISAEQRIAVYDGQGRLAAASRFTGTTWIPFKNIRLPQPEGEPCRFTPASQELHALVMGVRKPSAAEMSFAGVRPYLCGLRSEWFDPERFPCPDLKPLAEGR